MLKRIVAFIFISSVLVLQLFSNVKIGLIGEFVTTTDINPDYVPIQNTFNSFLEYQNDSIAVSFESKIIDLEINNEAKRFIDMQLKPKIYFYELQMNNNPQLFLYISPAVFQRLIFEENITDFDATSSALNLLLGIDISFNSEAPGILRFETGLNILQYMKSHEFYYFPNKFQLLNNFGLIYCFRF